MARVLVLAGLAQSLVNFRGPLLVEMARRGHQVHAAAPGLDADPAVGAFLRAQGITGHDILLDRGGLNPLRDLRALLGLARLMRRVKPDLVLPYTIKPVIWGLIAARLAGVRRRAALITGLGYAFTGAVQGKRALVQRIARALYRTALTGAEVVFFQNPDDAAEFARLGLLGRGAKPTIVDGSGVDLAHFAAVPLRPGPPRFLLIARLLRDKGIGEYVEAARQLRLTCPQAQCHLVGDVDANPDSFSRAEVEGWHTAGDVVWHGALADVRPALAACQVYVLPSYREGTPRTVLEAMATGRAIITTDAPGCRETVVDGENGFLVPVRDAAALANAMRRFCDDPALAAHLGEASRKLARRRYDVHRVNAAMLAALGL